MDYQILGSREAFGREWQNDVTIVMPFTDAAQAARSARLMAGRSGANGVLLAVHDDARDGFVRIVNRIFERSTSHYFGYVAQDAYAGRYWLRIALGLFGERRTQLVAFNDGKWFGRLASYGLARTSWARAVYEGSFFFPGYRSHYADTELSLIAAESNGLRYTPNSVLVEVDWEKDSRPVDPRDQRLFAGRLQDGFAGRVHSPALLEMFG